MAGQLSLPFISGFDPKGVNEAQRQLKSLGTGIRNFAKGVISAFGGVSATAGSVNFLRNSITQSRDLERQTAALKTIFGSTANEMMKFSKAGVSMGLSTQDAAKASTFLGSVLKQAGFSMQDTSAYTKQLVGLASDLAATYGYDVTEALTGMTALFRGEYDPIEKFGVAMKQAQVNAILAAQGQNHLKGAELLHAQQLVRLQLLLEKTSDAQGAFSRQGNSLFVQQSKLAALWKNMQATVGQQLTPALTKFLQQIAPIVQNFAPNLEKIFASFGSMIDKVTPKLTSFADKFATAFESIGKTFEFFLPLLEGMSSLILENINQIIAFTIVFKTLKGAVNIVVGAIKAYEVGLKLAAVASKELTLAELASGWGAVAIALGLVVTMLVDIGIQMANNMSKIDELSGKVEGWVPGQSRAAGRTPKPKADFSKYSSDEQSRFLKRQGQFAADLVTKTTKSGITDSQQGTKTAVKTFFTDLAEEVKKQAIRVKLSTMGASQGLIDAILGSNSWQATANKIISGGAGMVASLQAQFNKTKSGLDEIAKSLEDYNKKVQAAADFTKEIADAIKGLSGSGITESLGAFEQNVVSTFESIVSKVNDAVSNQLITADDASNLLNYASASEVAMRAIAKQRDALAERIAQVQQLITSTKQAVLGFANITTMLESQSRTVTETIVSVTNGIQLTLSRSMDVSAVSGSITDRFREILNKTKQFALNLKELKRLGLNENLFQQIVDAGLDAGGQTAAAIIEGGAGTVSELNGLFAELDLAGTSIAETTAQVMFGSGMEITNGLIDGLLSQQSELEKAALTLANAFRDAFTAQLQNAIQVNLPTPELAPTNPNNFGSGSGRYLMASVGQGEVFMPTAPKQGPTVNVTVNAGLGANGAQVGQEIVDFIKSYERVSGAVWQSA